jgi:phosphate transport system substrate-binding protein
VKVSLSVSALALLAGACFLRAAELPCASAESMDGLMQAWTAGFTAQHPGTPARITLRAKFSADFTDPLARGEVRVAPYARELFATEQARITQLAGGAPQLVPVATGSRATKGGTHAIVIFVNEKNPLARISLAQLREIFSRAGQITTWGQLGLTGGWAARKITLHGMKVRRETGNPPGIVNFLENRLLAGRVWCDDLHEYTDVPGGAQSLEQITRAVAADETAIGYSGFAYAVPGVKALALGEADTGPFYTGTEAEIAQRRYPLARTIYLVTGPAPDAVTREFLRYVLGPEGQGAITADAQGFFPLVSAP